MTIVQKWQELSHSHVRLSIFPGVCRSSAFDEKPEHNCSISIETLPFNGVETDLSKVRAMKKIHVSALPVKDCCDLGFMSVDSLASLMFTVHLLKGDCYGSSGTIVSGSDVNHILSMGFCERKNAYYVKSSIGEMNTVYGAIYHNESSRFINDDGSEVDKYAMELYLSQSGSSCQYNMVENFFKNSNNKKDKKHEVCRRITLHENDSASSRELFFNEKAVFLNMTAITKGKGERIDFNLSYPESVEKSSSENDSGAQCEERLIDRLRAFKIPLLNAEGQRGAEKRMQYKDPMDVYLQIQEMRSIEVKANKLIPTNGNGLIIKESKIPHAKEGLFATRHYGVGSVLAAFGGDIIHIDENDRNYLRDNFEEMATHIISIRRDVIIDGEKNIKRGGHAGSKANDVSFSKYVEADLHKKKLAVNSKIVKRNQSVLLIATREISPNDEIYTTYLTDYNQKECAQYWEKGCFCDKCGERFNNDDRSRLIRHKKMHHEKGQWVSCKICGKSTPLLDTLRHHVRRKHGMELINDEYIDCISGKKIDNNPVAGIKKESFMCMHCDNEVSDLKSLQRHFDMKHKRKEIMCPQCDFKTNYENKLRVHMLVHEQGKYACAICNKTFRNTYDLKRHSETHKLKTERKRKYTCKYKGCGRILLTLEGLKHHVSIQHEIKDRCSICHIPLAGSDRAKKEHMATHTGEKFHKCEECGKGFAQVGTLNKHLKAIHLKNGERKTWPCEQCDFIAKNSFHLNDHIRVKHNHRGYQCPVCDQVRTRRSNVKKHIMREHPDQSALLEPVECALTQDKKNSIKPAKVRSTPEHQCLECDYKSASDERVREHCAIQHHNYKYFCPECNKSFNRLGIANLHIAVLHKVVGKKAEFRKDEKHTSGL